MDLNQLLDERWKFLENLNDVVNDPERFFSYRPNSIINQRENDHLEQGRASNYTFCIVFSVDYNIWKGPESFLSQFSIPPDQHVLQQVEQSDWSASLTFFTFWNQVHADAFIDGQAISYNIERSTDCVRVHFFQHGQSEFNDEALPRFSLLLLIVAQ